MAGWFTSRINASVVPAAPAAAPLGVGELVSALGRTAGAMADQKRQTDLQVSKIDLAIAEREKAAAQDRANGEIGVAQAQSEGDFERYYTDVRNDPDAYTKINARIEADKAALRARLGNDQDLINHWEPIFERMAQARRTQAYQYIAAARAQASALTGKQALALAMDNAALHPERTGEFADAEHTRVMGDSSIPADLRPVVAQANVQQINLRGAVAAARSGRYDAVAKEIEAGTFTGKLPEGGLEALQRVVDAERGSAEVAARAAAADQQRAAREAVAQVKVAIDHGEEIPVNTLESVLASAKAAGLPQSEVMEASYLGQKMVFAQRARKLEDGPLRTQIATLQARRAAGGAQALQPVEQRMLDQFEKEQDGRDKAQAADLDTAWNQGAAGQAATLAQLARLPADRRNAVASKMGKPELSIIGGLDGDVQRQGLLGMQLGKERKQDYMPIKVGDNTSEEQLRKVFDATLGAVKTDIGGQYNAMREAALAIYAGRQATSGTASGWNKENFQWATKVAFGATMRGDGTWQGGLGSVRGRQVILPGQMNESEFDRFVSRFDYAGGGAVYGDGKPAVASDIAAHYRPMIDHQDQDGSIFYRMQGPSGPLWDARAKRVFLLPVRPR